MLSKIVLIACLCQSFNKMFNRIVRRALLPSWFTGFGWTVKSFGLESVPILSLSIVLTSFIYVLYHQVLWGYSLKYCFSSIIGRVLFMSTRKKSYETKIEKQSIPWFFFNIIQLIRSINSSTKKGVKKLFSEK